MSCYDLAAVCFANQKLSCASILLGLLLCNANGAIVRVLLKTGYQGF
jgi:hypothetical protein